ncbi:MAG: prepilin-type N-terminal cleavage/methylation domain-containing protein [Planctomycetota bacterium]|nr:prepilin-type N-terminal cleavage/methylation domain-containing protein [Planctomycetota bacterium]
MVRRSTKGITLLEVLLVLLILGLLAAAAIPSFVYSGEARGTECRSNITLISAAVEHYTVQAGGRPPATRADLVKLIEADKERFPKGMPRCPYGRPYDYDPAGGCILAHRH